MFAGCESPPAAVLEGELAGLDPRRAAKTSRRHPDRRPSVAGLCLLVGCGRRQLDETSITEPLGDRRPGDDRVARGDEGSIAGREPEHDLDRAAEKPPWRDEIEA